MARLDLKAIRASGRVTAQEIIALLDAVERLDAVLVDILNQKDGMILTRARVLREELFNDEEPR